jgi:transcriptional regulator with XRE-family HTH domain
MTSPLSFGNNLRAKRQELEIKQKELAQTVGISAQSLSVYEKGVKLPPLEVAVKLAEALGVSLDWLTGLSDDTANDKTGIQTQGDAARSIVALMNTGCISAGIVERSLITGSVTVDVSFCGSLADFVENLHKIWELQASGALPSELASAALDGLYKKLDGESASHSADEPPF